MCVCVCVCVCVCMCVCVCVFEYVCMHTCGALACYTAIGDIWRGSMALWVPGPSLCHWPLGK